MQNSGENKTRSDPIRKRNNVLIWMMFLLMVPLTLAIIKGRNVQMDFKHGESQFGVKIEGD